MKAPAPAFICLLLLPLLAGCMGDDESEFRYGTYVSVREASAQDVHDINWTVDVDAQGLDSLPPDLQELLLEAQRNGTATRVYFDESTQPLHAWVNDQWVQQGHDGRVGAWPLLTYNDRTFVLSYLLT